MPGHLGLDLTIQLSRADQVVRSWVPPRPFPLSQMWEMSETAVSELAQQCGDRYAPQIDAAVLAQDSVEEWRWINRAAEDVLHGRCGLPYNSSYYRGRGEKPKFEENRKTAEATAKSEGDQGNIVKARHRPKATR